MTPPPPPPPPPPLSRRSQQAGCFRCEVNRGTGRVVVRASHHDGRTPWQLALWDARWKAPVLSQTSEDSIWLVLPPSLRGLTGDLSGLVFCTCVDGQNTWMPWQHAEPTRELQTERRLPAEPASTARRSITSPYERNAAGRWSPGVLSAQAEERRRVPYTCGKLTHERYEYPDSRVGGGVRRYDADAALAPSYMVAEARVRASRASAAERGDLLKRQAASMAGERPLQRDEGEQLHYEGISDEQRSKLGEQIEGMKAAVDKVAGASKAEPDDAGPDDRPVAEKATALKK